MLSPHRLGWLSASLAVCAAFASHQAYAKPDCDRTPDAPVCNTDPKPKPPKPPAPVHGTLAPRYLILTVVYAPPGTQGGHGPSSVSYGSGSTTGTTTTISNSFKSAGSVTLDASGGFLAEARAAVSFGYGRSKTNSNALEIKKTSTTTIKADGPSSNGIDHDGDIIYLWLNPKIDLAVTQSTAAWMLTGTNIADIQYVHVAWLKNPQIMPAGVAQRLQTYGITTAEYPNILARDPLAGGAAPDPQRYQPINMTFPYEPPLNAGDSPPTDTYALTNSVTNTNSSTIQDDYKVGVSVEGGVSFLGLAKSKLKVDGSLEWTNTSARSSSDGSTESASLTISGPSYGYEGSTDVMVYYDTVYRTFAFRFLAPDEMPALTGRLVSSSRGVAGKVVEVVSNGIVYRSVTDAGGNYRVFGHLNGPVQLRVDGVTKLLPQVRPDQAVKIEVR